jgi:PAS domain S-box-containing protein
MGRSRRAWWVALSAGIVTVVGGVDALIGGDVVLIALLSAGPLVASTRLGPRTTATVSAYAIAAGIFLGVAFDELGSADHAIRVAVLGAICLVAVWAADLAERLRRSRDQLQAILENVADGVTAQEPGGRLVFANRAAVDAVGLGSAEEMMDAPRDDVVGRFELFDEAGNRIPVDRLPGRRALRGESPEPTVIRYRARDTGEERWSVVKSTPIRDEAGDVVLAISVMEDVTDRMRAERAEHFLSQASKLLAASLDYPTTMRHVAELAVPEIADWCAVDVLDDHGGLRQVALAAADEADVPLARELRDRYPIDPADPTGVRQVIRTGDPELFPEIGDYMLAGAARDERHLELLRALGMTSVMIAPMTARGGTLGAMTFVSSRSGRHFDIEDLGLAEELARRAATAVDNARLYGERAYIARALQESLLPPTLPEIGGVEVAARFRAAGDGNEVGGDFYDLFDTGAARWAVVMGDVCGKGARAAALTGLARYTLRAAAMREERPSAVLSTLNEALVRQRSDEQFCTVAFARLERNGDGTRITVASGGHPLPLLLRADGRVDSIGTPGSLLGIMSDPQLRDDSVRLEPGDAVVLYTDGVTDARAPDRVLSPADLAGMLRECAGLDAAAIAERIERAATAPAGPGAGGEPRDDVAILVLRVRDQELGVRRRPDRRRARGARRGRDVEDAVGQNSDLPR